MGIDSPSLMSRMAPSSIWWLAVELFIAYRLGLILWRIRFHPLASIPGPKLYAASYLPFLFQNQIRGTFVKDVFKLHEKYGPIVRISPDRISVDGSIGWSEVFARRPHQAEFDKNPRSYGDGDRIGLLPSRREDHRRQRQTLAHAFSTSAITKQQKYLKHYIDLLMTRFEEACQANHAVDVTRWFNYLTFDIIGELAFGDPFRSLEMSDYHPWIAKLFGNLKAIALLLFYNHYTFLRPLIPLFGAKYIRYLEETRELARVKTEKRLALGTEGRQDFFTFILRHDTRGTGMTHEEKIQNANSLLVAGSETTATTLSGLIFYLGLHKEVYDILTQEIRVAFKSEEEINIRTASSLQYLHACLEETLRIYPPAGETPPRVSPGDSVGGYYIPKGTHVSIYQWATHHSSRNFIDPDSFRPQRFLPATHPLHDTRFAGDNKEAFRPFAAGPRDCVGKNLAYAEMNLVVARLLWKFDIDVLEGQEEWISSQRVWVLWDKGPLMVRLRKVTAD